MENNITFCSYNVKNYDLVKYEAVKTLFQSTSFLLLQETWLIESEFIRKFKNDFPNSECISASKMDIDGVKPGRPYGGVGICYHSNIRCSVVQIASVSKSICALKIKLGNIQILLINVYMPSSYENEAIDEYSVILEEISSICIKSDTQHIIMGGDWNADPIRNDRRTNLFKEFIKNENLYNVYESYAENVPYTFMSANQIGQTPSTSTIDHFLISPNLKTAVRHYQAEYLYNNFSDHVPIVLSLNIDVELHKTHEKEFKPSVAWYKCTSINENDYRSTLDELLLKINPKSEALSCQDHKCTIHTEYIQKLHNEVIMICSEASSKCLPYTSKDNGNNGKKFIPGWNEYVKEHAEKSKFWHEIWLQSGKPRQGAIANERRKSRLKYHYAIRFVKNENIRIRNNRMAEAIAENNDRNLWDEAKKMSRTNNELPSAIDGVSDLTEITEIFTNKYDALYNSVSYNTHDMNKLMENVDTKIGNIYSTAEERNHNQYITVNDIKKAISQLKSGKKEENGLSSNHFKIGSERLFIVISLLFNSMLSHGIAPDELLLGTMIPLIKDSRGNKQCSDNYRSLTIGTGLSKLLEIVIRNQQGPSLKSSDLQFGFKENSSTTMCTFMVLETIEYYKKNGSNVHVLLLDASKAFDRVNYIKLFEKLLGKGMCPLTVRLLINMYTNQKLQVKWNNQISQKFNVTNGVRQGGVLSPLLFSIYVDELLDKLKQSDTGCHIGQYYVGALGYADDLILLCPSVSGMNKMIKICEDYAREHQILFNGAKSKYLIFGNYKYNPILKVNNESVPRSNSAMHLGHLLRTENTQDALVENTLNNFNGSFHSFMARFGSCNITSRNRLFHQYCSSMYGSQLWLITNKNVEKLYTRWRVYHRRILGVVNTTHCDLLPLITSNLPLDCILDLKYIAFFKTLMTTKNSIVKFTANIRLLDQTSTLSKNVKHLTHKYGISKSDMLSTTKYLLKKHCYNKWIDGINELYPVYASIIKEMIEMKEDRCNRFFSNDDCNFIINFLCTI